ncbi:hypothetical protein SELMODRAFT_419423 [Selaginella moellendorffii]|uniref:Uncharacterized protein n=1 Tax=Selaginella moellendorffii TaxID=88036 RepID=D8S8W5_SELML|nr:hypothetical protein SELMODRAFT_419423 [Selaginella moellendorffii]
MENITLTSGKCFQYPNQDITVPCPDGMITEHGKTGPGWIAATGRGTPSNGTEGTFDLFSLGRVPEKVATIYFKCLPDSRNRLELPYEREGYNVTVQPPIPLRGSMKELIVSVEYAMKAEVVSTLSSVRSRLSTNILLTLPLSQDPKPFTPLV